MKQIKNTKKWLTWFLISDEPVFIAIKLFLATIAVSLMTIGLSHFSFQYDLDLYEISQYYAILAYLLLFISFLFTLFVALICLISKKTRIGRLFIAVQQAILFFLLFLFVMGFFRK
ncbi:MAG: hypothetical protein MUE81_05005 [Thermoflexibacter sp.]|jgi:hypothetical protein|nr:hypothetical protein [Thermoflexibacter sp.]